MREIAADFHARLPRQRAVAIGAVYARYSTRFQSSIVDQVRSLFEAALREQVFIPLENVFFDVGVRGYRDQRPGLNDLRSALAAGRLNVLFVLATNRLFRRLYKSLQFVEEEIVERGVRCVFTQSRIDTADVGRWRTFLQIHGALDESVVGMYADFIRNAHEGLFNQRRVYGTLALGYKGEPIPGEFTKRKLPSCRIVIDPETSSYVIQVFHWYVCDLVSMDEIVRRLNGDPKAPLPVKSTEGVWSHQAVRGLLTNPRYRGWWEYGKKETVWLSKQDYARQFPRAEPLKAEQIEELRLVSDEIWYGTQDLLAKEKKNRGRKPKDGNRKSRPKILNDILRCPNHDRRLEVGGVHGTRMFCKRCKGMNAEQRPLYSQVNRQLTMTLVCERLASLVQQDAGLVQDIIAACQLAAEELQRPDPARLEQLRSQVDRLTRNIEFNQRNVGETSEDQAQTARLIRQLREERQQMQREFSCVEAAMQRQIAIPSESDVRALIADLGKVLTAAAHGASEEEIANAGEIIRVITGGRIYLYQQGERKAQRGWLQGRFTVRLIDFLVSQVMGVTASSDDEGVKISIDFRRERISKPQADRAYELDREGKLLRAAIACELKVSPSRLDKLLKGAYAERGEQMPDGSARRSQLVQKQLSPPLYQRISDEVKRLWDDPDLLIDDIAKRLNCDPNTVTVAIAFWHTSRGLPVPDGRTRRKSLDRKVSKPRQRPDGSPSDDSLTA